MASKTDHKGRGATLWVAITERIASADPRELALLHELCRVLDTIEQLEQQVADDGVMLDSSQGRRVHPAIVEARQQRLAASKLAAGLDISSAGEPIGSSLRSVS